MPSAFPGSRKYRVRPVAGWRQLQSASWVLCPCTRTMEDGGPRAPRPARLPAGRHDAERAPGARPVTPPCPYRQADNQCVEPDGHLGAHTLAMVERELYPCPNCRRGLIYSCHCDGMHCDTMCPPEPCGSCGGSGEVEPPEPADEPPLMVESRLCQCEQSTRHSHCAGCNSTVDVGESWCGRSCCDIPRLLEPLPPLRWCQHCGGDIGGQGRRICAMCAADVAEREEHRER